MSKTIKIKSLKKGFKVSKIQVVANEHYIIVDETGKTFDKLKFVQKDKDLEVYIEKDGKEEQIAILEDYYEPNMNASVVSLDTVTNQEIGYITQNDGWSYSSLAESSSMGILEYSAIGLGVIGAGIAIGGGGGGSSSSDETISTPEVQALTALEKIANYADSNTNPAPTVQDYIDAGITGVDAANLNAVNAKVDAVAKTDADTVPEVQALADSGNTTADTALEKIANYADSNTNPAPTVQDYIDAGITGVDAANLAAVNAKVDAVAKTDADTVPEVQALADSGNTTADTALEKIANYADSNTNPAPTVQDYLDAGIIGVDAANLAAVNAKVDAVAKTDADTVPEVQALADSGNTTADTALEKIANYADSNTNPAPTVQDYLDAGIIGVDAANLAAVNAKVDAVAKTDADTVPEVQALADSGNTTADTALEKIANYADSNTNPAPTVQDYLDAGITGVDASNLDKANAGIDSVAKNDADTQAEIQSIVDVAIVAADGNEGTAAQDQAKINAIEKISNYADDSNNPAPSVEDYISAGITGVDASNLDKANAGIDSVAKNDADTQAEIQSIVDVAIVAADGNEGTAAQDQAKINAIEKISNYADDSNNPAPSVEDYISAGITGVDASNLDKANAGIDSVAKNDADTQAEIQSIVDVAISAADGNEGTAAQDQAKINAIEKISNYADDSNNPAPSVEDYISAGIIGVDAANLAAVNAKVDAVAKTDADTVPEVQALADSGNTTADTALEKIANYADSNTNPAPTVQDYLDAGIIGVDAANLAAVNAKVDAVAKTDADTVPEVQALADSGNTTADTALEKIANYADSNTNPAPTVQDYLDAGIIGVDAANLAAVNAKVDAVAKTDADTVPEVQALADSGNTTADTALEKIANYADSNTNPAPTVQDYLDAGITGVDASNLDKANAGIDSVAKNDADTQAEIQSIVDVAIVAADGNEGTAAQDQAKINAIEKISNYADDSNNPAPSVEDYISAGITGVDASNLDKANAGIDSVAKNDADTQAEIQSIVDVAIVAADGNEGTAAQDQAKINAIEKISNYADDSNNPAPSVEDYISAGITGVDASNLDKANAGIDSVAKNDADTQAEIQSIVDVAISAADGNEGTAAQDQAKINAIEKISNYADDSNNPAPSVEDYISAGIIGVDAANLAAVNAKVDAVAKTDADTVPEVQALADSGNTTADTALEKIANYADSNTNPAPTVQDYLDAGIIGVDAANLAAVNAKVDAVAKTDADTVPEVQALADSGNTTADTALEKIANYADSNTNPAPTVQDYLDAGIIGVDAANLNAVNAKVDAVAKVDADTVPEVQALADAGNTTADTALEKIANYADSNTNPAPTVQDYLDAGIIGVDAANLAAVNAKVDAVAKVDADTVPEVQALADAGNTTADTALEKIANYADSNANPAPTVQDYIDAGITGVDAANLNATNAAIDAVIATDADTVPEIQAIADSAKVLSIQITSATGNQNSYLNAGDTVTATVTMSEIVNITGTPQLAFNIGGAIVQADYVNGTGTNTLTFTYSVLANQTDADGISIDANSLSLNGGTIQDVDGTNAILTTLKLSDNASYLVDTNAPSAPVINTIAGNDIINSSEQSSVITGTNEAGATVSLSIGGTLRAATVTGTTWSYTLVAADITAMGQGAETITATQTDVAGNVSTLASKSISIDTIAPSAPVINTIATDDIINASEQSSVITGTNESGATVSLLIGGTTRAATVTGTTWSYTLAAADITAMGQGAKTITATQTDAAGNTSTPASKTISIDTIAPSAPVINTIATDNIINASEQSSVITGTNESGATVSLSIGGTLRAATVTGTTWSYTLVAADITAMGQGAKTITATQTDAAGNTSTPASKTIFIDTIAPSAPVINTISTDDIINASEQSSVITGTNESGATVSLSIGGTTRAATVTGTTWSYTLAAADITAMGQGAKTITATQTDAAGNTSTPASKTISIDTIAPSAPVINAIATDNIINASEQSSVITGTNESGATVSLSIGGATRAATVTGTTWSYTLAAADITAMGQGAKTITATQTDAAGNTSTPASKTIFIDTIAPSAPVINTIATDDIINASEQSSVITGTNESGATVSLLIGGATRAATVTGTTWSYTLAAADITAMGQGAKTITATQTDAAGNTSTPASKTISIDTIAPSAPVINAIATDNIINASEQSSVITGTNESGATVSLSIGGATRAATVTGTTWSYTLAAADITAMGQGAKTITATQTDAAGNTSTPASKTIFIDTIAPSAPVINTIATDDIINASEQSSVITGTNESGATVSLLIGGATRAATVTGTTWSYTLAAADITAMGQGAKTITATQTDAAGNTSTPASKTISIDTIAPSAPVINAIATDNIINASEQSSVITGTNESGATVSLSIGGATRAATVTGTTWSYTLAAADITAMGQGAETITATQTDAAGNTSTPASKTISIDTIAPSAPVINAIAGNDIINSSEQSSVITGTNEAGATVSLLIGGATRAATVTGTTWSYTLVAADITAMGQGAETITATQTDAAGNTSTPASKTISIDTSAPIFSSTGSASTPENVSTATTVYDADATDNGGSVDSGLLYSFVTTGGLDYSLFNINTTNGNVTFKTSPDYENPTDIGSNNIYDFTIRATDTVGNYADKNVALTVSDAYEAGQSVIDLGAGNGKLINGVQVEGKWYYFWDKSGDGTSAGVDYVTHDLLDGIFNHDVTGVTNTTVANIDGLYGTTDIYRYGTINGVSLALPTYGETGAFTTGYKSGTAVSLNTTTENPTYDGLLAIWDSFNGTVTGTNINGTPSGWTMSDYWSASLSSSGYANVSLDNGVVNDYNDTYYKYVAFEVL